MVFNGESIDGEDVALGNYAAAAIAESQFGDRHELIQIWVMDHQL